MEDTEPAKFRLRLEPQRLDIRRWAEPQKLDPEKWSHSFTCLLARHRCTRCHGSGQSNFCREGYPCGCVTRRIFGKLLARYFAIQQAPALNPSRNTLRTGRGAIWSRKDLEFCADFVLLARRVLTPQHLRIFEMYFLARRDHRECLVRLPDDYMRGSFFHEVYRIEQLVGHVARTLKPYALYPVEEYLRGPVQRRAKPTPCGRTI